MKDEDITVTVAEPLLLGADYFTLNGGNAPGSLAFMVSEHPLSILPPPTSPGVLVVDDICSMVETPTRTYRLTDLDGQPPPMVPTVEAIETWGEHWWAGDQIVRVSVVDDTVWVEEVGQDYPIRADNFRDWLGPVTERPKEKG